MWSPCNAAHIWLLCSGWQQGNPSQGKPAGFPKLPKMKHNSCLHPSLLCSPLPSLLLNFCLPLMPFRGSGRWWLPVLPYPEHGRALLGQSKLWCTREWVCDQLREEGRGCLIVRKNVALEGRGNIWGFSISRFWEAHVARSCPCRTLWVTLRSTVIQNYPSEW